MSSTVVAGPASLFRHRSLLLFLSSRSLLRFASQIAAVAIGWQVYELTDSAFALGMIGLVQFLPAGMLVFVAGHAADRFDRRRVMQACQLAEALIAVLLALGAYHGSLTVPQIFVATLALGTLNAFEGPATAALLPLVAPEGTLQRATAMSSGSSSGSVSRTIFQRPASFAIALSAVARSHHSLARASQISFWPRSPDTCNSSSAMRAFA